MNHHLQSILNWEQLRGLSGGDQDFEKELLYIYLQDTTQQLQHLESAAVAADLPRVRELAHHIKGASANVGATAISDSAATIENAAKNREPAAIAGPLQALRQDLNQLQQHIG